MRIDRYHQPPVPSGAAGKPSPVAAVEPVAAASSARRKHGEPLFGARVILDDAPLDRRVRQALEAYLRHRAIPNESVAQLLGVDVYV